METCSNIHVALPEPTKKKRSFWGKLRSPQAEEKIKAAAEAVKNQTKARARARSAESYGGLVPLLFPPPPPFFFCFWRLVPPWFWAGLKGFGFLGVIPSFPADHLEFSRNIAFHFGAPGLTHTQEGFSKCTTQNAWVPFGFPLKSLKRVPLKSAKHGVWTARVLTARGSFFFFFFFFAGEGQLQFFQSSFLQDPRHLANTAAASSKPPEGADAYLAAPSFSMDDPNPKMNQSALGRKRPCFLKTTGEEHGEPTPWT